MWCFRTWPPQMTKGYLYGCFLRVWDVPYLENLRASICVFTLPSTHTQFRPNQVEACRAHVPREVLILYRQQSQHLPATPLGICPCTIKCLSCLKYPTFKQKSIRSAMFFNRQKCTYFKISHSNKFLRWFKKNRVLKNLYFFHFTKMLREPPSEKSQENLGNEDLGKQKNLNIK